MKKLFLLAIFVFGFFMVKAQVIDETNKNITGFNRIQTENSGWMDIQLKGTGSSFKIHDLTNSNNWVKWTAGSSYTEFLEDIKLNGSIHGNIRAAVSNYNIIGFNRIVTQDGGWMDIQLKGTGSSFKIHDLTNSNNWVKWTAGSSYTEFLNNVYISSGSLGIGTVETGTHKLAVEGTIGAREIKVEADTWSDFVFNTDYELRNLEEVESFIEENNHLPDIPSEKEVLENGVSLGEMNAKLLQKIEELTLYMIEQNKKTEKLIEKVNKFESENEILKNEISSMKTQ